MKGGELMKTKTVAMNCFGISLVLVMLACTFSGVIQPVNAQSIVHPPGASVSMWTSQRYYGYGQEVYLTIFTSYPLHRARLEIRQWGGPDYRMDLGYLWPGQYTIDVGQSSPPAARVNFILFDGWHQVAYTSCGTGP
jgi:hypothetical protein